MHALFFDRCESVTDTCKKMFLSLFGSLLNHPFPYTIKNVSVKPLFHLHYLSLFQLPFTRSKIVHFAVDLFRNYNPQSLGSFWKTFREV